MHTSADTAVPVRLRTTPSRLLTQTAALTHRLVSERLAAAQAHRYHYSLLAALHEFGPASQAALGRRCDIDRSDVTTMLNELADNHFVARSHDPLDHRRNCITITPAGIRRLRQLDRLVARIQDELFAPLSMDERDQLAHSLTRVLDHHHDGRS